MARMLRRKQKQPGTPPGSLIHIGVIRQEKVDLQIYGFDSEQYQYQELSQPEEVKEHLSQSETHWLNINGLHETDIIKQTGDIFDIHSLWLEDMVNTSQRPKLEEYDGKIYLAIKMLRFDEAQTRIFSEQISIILHKNWVLTFQECQGDVFDPVRQRVKTAKSKIRSKKADYLFYSLLDCIVDNYFVVLESIGDHIEQLQEKIEIQPSQEILHQIHHLKREMIYLRKNIWPVREILTSLTRNENKIFATKTTPYLRDVYDHTMQIIDAIENYREMLNSLTDLYLSSVSNRMNEVMKVLTIIATIFIPLTFIAGIYGMNFANMPELSWHWGYFVALAIMAITALAMIVWFKYKKWI